MAAETFCIFAEYLQNTAEALEVKPKETGLLSDCIPLVISWIAGRSQKNPTHVNT